MPSLVIADVPWISKRIKACCRRAKLFSTDEILFAQPQQLQQALCISPAELELLVLQVATAAAPPPVSVLDALNGRPPSPLDPDLFDVACHRTDPYQDDDDDDDDDDSDRSLDVDHSHGGLSIIPPTQGYDGNFPGVERYVYDSDSDSDSHADARSEQYDMHDDVEMSSTIRAQVVQNAAAIDEDNDEDNDEDDNGRNDDALDASYEMHNHNHAAAARTSVRDVLSLGRDRHVFTTGSDELDQLLGGGLRCSLLTELVGESGSGKTQIAVQAATFAALGLAPIPLARHPSAPQPFERKVSDQDTLRDILQGFGMAQWNDGVATHSGVGVCFITSAGERGVHSIVKRALELADFAVRERFAHVYPPAPSQAEQRQEKEPGQSSQAGRDRHMALASALKLSREQVLQNLHVACVADVEALEHALKYSVPGLISRVCEHKRGGRGARQIGMVVVDDLPSLFQEDPVAGDIDSLVQRSKQLGEIGDALKRIAAPATQRPVMQPINSRDSNASGRVVVVVNHVSDAFGLDKDIARRFVVSSAPRPTPLREAAYPDTPVAMHFAWQSSFVTGLLAGDRNHPRTAQLGHSWSNTVNVRLFLSRIRSRTQDSVAAPTTRSTVRKVGVLLNPFSASMLDLPAPAAAEARRTPTTSLKFIITPQKAVQTLAPSPDDSHAQAHLE